MKSAPIGIIDSGIGGISILEEIQRILPSENILYFADTAHFPYGNKSKEFLQKITKKNARFLAKAKAKILVLACHSASIASVKTLENFLSIPIVTTIKPSLSLLTPYRSIALLGTEATIQSKVFQNKAYKQNPDLSIFPQACPLFVSLAEEGFAKHAASPLIAQTYLSPLRQKIEAAILCCTHFSFLSAAIQSALGSSIDILDPSRACAQTVLEVLKNTNKLNPSKKKGKVTIYVSGAPTKMLRKLQETSFSLKELY